MSDDAIPPPSDSAASRPSERVVAHPSLQAAMAFAQAPLGLALIDERDRLQLANLAFCDLVGLSLDAMQGRRVAEVLPIGETASLGLATVLPAWRHLAFEGLDGENRELLFRLADVDDGRAVIHRGQADSKGVQESALRVLTLFSLDELLAAMPGQDAFSGMVSRWLFQDRLFHAMERADRLDQGLALLLIELDDHPALPERVDRQAAWKTMRQVARRIGQTFRGEDSVARLGAARWGVLIEHPVSPQSLQVAALRCLEVMDAPFEAAGRPLLLTTSIGIARYPEDGETDEELMACAERALGRATRSGPGGYDFFDARLRQGLEAEQDFRRELQEALLAPGQHFHVVYQPVVEPRSGQWQSLEALVRWEHPRRGLLYPRDFLPDAAAMGQLIRLDRWVLEQVIFQHRQWDGSGSALAMKGVSVNLAATMLEQRVFDGRPLDQFLRAQGQALSWLSLEFEVSGLIARGPAHRHLLERLKQLGVTLMVDDVGTQPIDLVQLAMLPFHRAKVGRGLVAGIGKQRHVEQALAALREGFMTLKIDVILVGVETPHQRDMALAMGFEQMQGNLFSPPLAEGELGDWAQAQSGS